MLSSATPTRQVRVDVAKCQPATQSEGLMSPRAPPGTHRAAASTASTGTQARHQSQPNAIRGCCFFPLRKCIFSVAEPFWVAKLGFLCCWFFVLPRPVFFLPPTGFFLPRTVFSCCLQNAFYLLQRCFLLLQGVFSAALNFFPAPRIFCWRFSPLRKQFFTAAIFFSCCQTCFLRSDVFSCCEPVFFARCAETRS